MANLCLTDCVRDTPSFGGVCEQPMVRGGIPYIIIFSCDWQFGGDVTINGVDTTIGAITDYTQWTIGVQNKKIVRSPKGIGSKPTSEFATTERSSCDPPEIIDETHILNFLSKEFDADDGEICAFWQDVRTNYRKFRIGYQDCDGRVYVSSSIGQPGWQFSLTAAGLVIPETSQEPAYFEFNSSWREQGFSCPVVVPNIDEAFNADILT